MKVVLPLGSIGWKGGDSYVESLRIILEELINDKQIEVVEYRSIAHFVFKFKKLLGKRLCEVISYQIYGHSAVNLPWPIVARKRRPIFWIPDIQDLEVPENFDSNEVKRRDRERTRVINRGGFFYFSSAYMESAFLKHYPSAKSVGVVRFTSNMTFERVETVDPQIECKCFNDNSYLYAPNQWWIHKNHKLLIGAYSLYRMTGGKKHLVLSGPQNDSRAPELESEILDLILTTPYEIHNFGLISRNFQIGLFLNSAFVVQVSSYEGWSTIVEESLKFQKPLLLSDIPVHREQASNEPLAQFCNSNDVSSIAVALKEMDNHNEHLKCNYDFRQGRFKNDLIRMLEKYKSNI